MSGTSSLQPALFLDRDGTLIADAHFLADPTLVRLLPNAARAVARINGARVLAIIVTNQSGIARGLISSAQYEAVRTQTDALLARGGAHVDATYHCPHWPDVSGLCDCRKPSLGMYSQAAQRFGIDLARSAYVGDRWRDVQPAQTTGGFGVLIPGVETPEADVERARLHAGPRIRIASSVLEAVELALASIAVAHLVPAT